MNWIGSLKRIALFVTAQARSIMVEAMAAVRNKGLIRQIYYMDTDSFMLSHAAFDAIKDAGLVHQSALGLFKDEIPDDEITEAMYVAPKVYYYKTQKKYFVG
jgi:DNA polymerase elongation subunit (family B)